MEELSNLVKNQLKEERYRVFRLIARSMNPSTRFMVPDEQSRTTLGHDGAVSSGREALKESVKSFLARIKN
ncbi:MAG: hypothetical protein ABEK50_01340 [bacterium]